MAAQFMVTLVHQIAAQYIALVSPSICCASASWRNTQPAELINREMIKGPRELTVQPHPFHNELESS